MVNHPDHYKTGKYECIEVMKEIFGEEKVQDFCKMNAFKYIWRADRKNGIEDLNKAKWYLDTLLLGEKDWEEEDEDQESDELFDEVIDLRKVIDQISEGVKDAMKTIAKKLTDEDKRYEKFQEYKSQFTEKTAFVLAMHTRLEEDDEQHDA